MRSGSPLDRRRFRTARMRAGVVACLTGVLLAAGGCRGSTLPPALTDREFQALIDSLSEPEGSFDVSDTFVSNETHYPELVRSIRASGGVYVGVGPEQNFSYIAELRPTLAFIVDIRRENLCLHLLYKALFEMSADRADFVSRLFSRPRPPDLASGASVDAMFERFARVPRSDEQYEATLGSTRERLVNRHGLPLSEKDLGWIRRALEAFYTKGPDINFWGSRPSDEAGPSYRLLMTARDFTGRPRSFLATDEGFRFVKDLHARNLIVPVVGDFAGPSAIRRIGDYLRARRAAVRVFYASNVGAYLNREQSSAFCRNLAALPAAPRAWFIESNRMRSLTSKLRACRPRAEQER